MFGTASHGGKQCREITGGVVVARILQDDGADRLNDIVGFVQSHEGSPLVSGDYVVVPTHSGDGFLTDDGSDIDRARVHWSVQTLKWFPSVTAPNAVLRPVWKITTDWQPVDSRVLSFGGITNGYLAQFQPVISVDRVYFPSDHGSVTHVDLATGRNPVTIAPLAGTEFAADPRTIVNNALSVAPDGSVWYDITAHPLDVDGVKPVPGDLMRGSWIVQVRADDTFRIATWDSAVASAPGIPAENDLCEWPFGTNGTPFFPRQGPATRAPLFECGAQRPALNAPIAFTAVGHPVVFSYSNNAQGAAFLVEVNPATLTPIHAADTRGHALHGCGVRISIDDDAFCRALTNNGTTNLGVDPDFNTPVRFRGGDLMDNAPAVDPAGGLTIGGYDGGFTGGGEYDARGFLVRFNSAGQFLAVNQRHGWEDTPSTVIHSDGSWSTLQDDQLYSLFDIGVASYSPTFVLEARGTALLPEEANAIDFLDAHIPVDVGGTHYAVNGDGHLYKFAADGTLLHTVELTGDDGKVRSIETLSGYFARDKAGRIYPSYGGSVYVIASGGGPDVAPSVSFRSSTRRIAGQVAKRDAGPIAPITVESAR
jgi:outer membrane protein assembly factor BamB